MSESWMPIAGNPVRQELDRLWLNQQASANNLANIQTPGFVGTRVARTDVPPEFRDVFSSELARTDPRHLSMTPPPLAQGYESQAVTDLSPDTEMAEVAKTSVSYQTLLEVVARRDRMARAAIEGR